VSFICALFFSLYFIPQMEIGQKKKKQGLLNGMCELVFVSLKGILL